MHTHTHKHTCRDNTHILGGNFVVSEQQTETLNIHYLKILLASPVDDVQKLQPHTNDAIRRPLISPSPPSTPLQIQNDVWGVLTELKCKWHSITIVQKYT